MTAEREGPDLTDASAAPLRMMSLGTTLYAVGRLDVTSVAVLRTWLELSERTSHSITLDLTQVSSIDSLCVRELFDRQHGFTEHGSVLRLEVPSHLRRRLAVCSSEIPREARVVAAENRLP